MPFKTCVRTFPELDETLQTSFVKSKEDVYRNLADLLIAEGRPRRSAAGPFACSRRRSSSTSCAGPTRAM